MLHVWLMVVFGIVGYVFKKLDCPLAPLMLVSGDAAESAFRQSMLISRGSLTVFWSNWLVGGLTTLALVLLAWPLYAVLRARLRAAEQAG